MPTTFEIRPRTTTENSDAINETPPGPKRPASAFDSDDDEQEGQNDSNKNGGGSATSSYAKRMRRDSERSEPLQQHDDPTLNTGKNPIENVVRRPTAAAAAGGEGAGLVIVV